MNKLFIQHTGIMSVAKPVYRFILSPRSPPVYLVPGDKIPRGILSRGTLYPGVECPPAYLVLGEKIP